MVVDSILKNTRRKKLQEKLTDKVEEFTAEEHPPLQKKRSFLSKLTRRGREASSSVDDSSPFHNEESHQAMEFDNPVHGRQHQDSLSAAFEDQYWKPKDHLSRLDDESRESLRPGKGAADARNERTRLTVHKNSDGSANNLNRVGQETNQTGSLIQLCRHGNLSTAKKAARSLRQITESGEECGQIVESSSGVSILLEALLGDRQLAEDVAATLWNICQRASHADVVSHKLAEMPSCPLRTITAKETDTELGRQARGVLRLLREGNRASAASSASDGSVSSPSEDGRSFARSFEECLDLGSVARLPAPPRGAVVDDAPLIQL